LSPRISLFDGMSVNVQTPQGNYALPGVFVPAETNLLTALRCNRCCPSCRSFWVQVGTTWVDDLSVLGDFIDQWNAGGDIQPGDIVIGDIVQVLHQRAQGVAVCCQQHGLTALCARQNFFLEVRNETLHDILEALGARNSV